MNNLKAEMVRKGIRVEDIERLLGCSGKTVRNKMCGKTDFTFGEAQRIRDSFFPGMTLEFLFAPDDAEINRGA